MEQQSIYPNNQIKNEPVIIKQEMTESVKNTSLDENNLILLISKVFAVLKPGNRRNMSSEQMMYDDIFKGMYWKKTKQKWVAEWDSSKRSTRVWKTFSVSRYGNSKAKQLAARARIEAELKGETSNNPEPLVSPELVEDLAQIILLSSNMDDIEKEELYEYLEQKKFRFPIINTFLNSRLFHSFIELPPSSEQFNTSDQSPTSSLITPPLHTIIEPTENVIKSHTDNQSTHSNEKHSRFVPVTKLRQLRNIFKLPVNPKSPLNKKIRKVRNVTLSPHTSPTLSHSDPKSNIPMTTPDLVHTSKIDDKTNDFSQKEFNDNSLNTKKANQKTSFDQYLHNPPSLLLLAKLISYVSSKLYDFRTDIKHYLLAIQTILKKGLLPNHNDFIKEVIDHAKLIKNGHYKDKLHTHTYELTKPGWLSHLC